MCSQPRGPSGPLYVLHLVVALGTCLLAALGDACRGHPDRDL